MSSTLRPQVISFKAAAAIAKGKAVKKGSADTHVAVCSAASDKSIGILQEATTAAEDVAEVAVAGGGGKALLGGTVAMGDMLVPDSDGALVASTSNAEKHIAQAMQDGVSGDIIAVLIVPGII